MIQPDRGFDLPYGSAEATIFIQEQCSGMGPFG
jgi:hypothetical protein